MKIKLLDSCETPWDHQLENCSDEQFAEYERTPGVIVHKTNDIPYVHIVHRFPVGSEQDVPDGLGARLIKLGLAELVAPV